MEEKSRMSMQELCEIKLQPLCSPEAPTCVPLLLFPTQTALETPEPVSTPCTSYTDPAAAATSRATDRSWDTAQLHAASQNLQGQAENKPPPAPLTAKPTPGAAQGVGTGLQESYQFV